MPLSSLGGLASTAMNNLQRSSEGIVQPLDAIEARRAKRAAEAQEERKTKAAQLKAQAQKQSAQEQQAAGEAKRLAAGKTQQVLSSMPEITVENMADPAFTQELRGQIKHLQNSGDPIAMDKSAAIMKQLETFSKTGGIDEPGQGNRGTLQSEQAGVSMNAKVSETEFNRSQTKMNQPEASAMATQWANAYINRTIRAKRELLTSSPTTPWSSYRNVVLHCCPYTIRLRESISRSIRVSSYLLSKLRHRLFRDTRHRGNLVKFLSLSQQLQGQLTVVNLNSRKAQKESMTGELNGN
jgi:hypothetical protein